MVQLPSGFEHVVRFMLRGMEGPQIIRVLELIKEELATRHVILEYTSEYRPPGPGK